MRPCNKDCIANVCGECAAEKCEGQIQRLEGYHSAEKATWAYKIAVDHSMTILERGRPDMSSELWLGYVAGALTFGWLLPWIGRKIK